MWPTRGIIRNTIFLVSFALLLTGCWNLEEVENRAFVLNLGIDAGAEGRVRITAQMPSPEAQTKTPGGTTGHSPVLTISAEGETAWQALGELDKQYPRKLYLGHLQAVIIGTALAEQGIDDIIDALMRFWETDRHAHVLLADDPQTILAHQTPSMVDPGQYIRQFFLSTIGIESVGDPRVWRFWRDTVSPHSASFAPFVRLDEHELKIGGFGVFQDGKLVRRLDETTSRGVSWVHGEIAMAALPVRWRQGTVTVRNTQGKSRIVAAGWRGEQPYVHVRLVISAGIEEIVPLRAMFTPDDFGPVEAELARLIEAEALQAIEETREAGTDIFMFGEWVRVADPQRWQPERWSEQFKEIDVDLDVSVKITGADLMR